MQESSIYMGLSSGFRPVFWASFRLRFPADCGSICLVRLSFSNTLATLAVSGLRPPKRGLFRRQTHERTYKCTIFGANLQQVSRGPQLAGNIKPQIPNFPQSAGNSPQQAGNLPALGWKDIRSPLERRSAAVRNDLRSWLEIFPQLVGNIPSLTSLFSTVSEPL